MRSQSFQQEGTFTGRPTPGRLSVAVGMLSLGLLLLAGCQLGGGQAASALPTPPPVPSFAPFNAATPGSPPQGNPAIRPHLSAIPAFTTQDMAQYVTTHPLPGAAGTPTITRNVFLPSQDVAQRTGVPIGRAGETLVGYVELQGSFAFPNLQGGAPFTYQAAYEVFDAQTGNLLLYGGLRPTPTPTPTSAPTPVVKFTVHPTSFTRYCDVSSSPLPALSVTLDNTGSTIAVSWSIQISDQDPKHTEIWASANPASGTTPAGGTTQVKITPASNLCSQMPNSTTPVPLHANVVLTGGGSGTTTVTDNVTPFVIS